MLLAIMLMMALMIIARLPSRPRVVQQIKRDREEEMIHRGTEYARAIKKFYKKNGRYPATWTISTKDRFDSFASATKIR